jgi:hypothetical protein
MDKKEYGWVQSQIRRATFPLNDGTLFATRQLTNLGLNRHSLDKALARMHKNGEIRRVARGVYQKGMFQEPPSLFEIARIKAFAFGRTLFPYTEDPAVAANSAEDSIEACIKSTMTNDSDLVVTTEASSSCFSSIVGRVIMKHIAPRKVFLEKKLNGCPLAFTVRTIWQVGRKKVNWKAVNNALLLSPMGREEKALLRRSGQWLPQWIAEVYASEFQPTVELDDREIYRPDQLRDMRKYRIYSKRQVVSADELVDLFKSYRM